MKALTFSNRPPFALPLARLNAFLTAEFAYYDAICSDDPFHITPLDVLVTVAMNSYVNSALAVRTVHHGMAEACDELLVDIPVDADLRSFDLGTVEHLLHAAVQRERVLLAVATKVLHRKRRTLIPMLDSVVMGYYADALGEPQLLTHAIESKAKAAAAARVVLEAFRADLVVVRDQLQDLQAAIRPKGFIISDVRMLEVLIWMEREPGGLYRMGPLAATDDM